MFVYYRMTIALLAIWVAATAQAHTPCKLDYKMSAEACTQVGVASLGPLFGMPEPSRCVREQGRVCDQIRSHFCIEIFRRYANLARFHNERKLDADKFKHDFAKAGFLFDQCMRRRRGWRPKVPWHPYLQ